VTVRPEDLRGDAARMYRAWRDIGMSEEATIAMLQRDGVIPVSEQDRAVQFFEDLGLSRSEAQTAAAGRGVPMLRPVSEAVPDWKRLLDQVSDAEIAELLAAEQRRRKPSSGNVGNLRQVAAKKTTTTKSSGKPFPRVVSEHEERR
jgi:hypothetical protein